MISDNTLRYLYVLFLCSYVIVLIISTEIFAYLWHRYIAHTDYIPGIGETHEFHHILYSNEADEDFIWILMLIILFEIIIGITILIGLIPGTIGIVTVVINLIVFWWNWWIHKAYHQSDHWLNSYNWFIQEKNRHFIHHENSNFNYGIASHFTDKILGTWIDPTSINQNSSA